MYDKRPSIKINGLIVAGWENIIPFITAKSVDSKVVNIECYTGLSKEELMKQFQKIDHSLFIDTTALFHDEKSLIALTERYMTDDSLFGKLTSLSLKDYFDKEKINDAKLKIQNNSETTLIVGPGSLLVEEGDVVI